MTGWGAWVYSPGTGRGPGKLWPRATLVSAINYNEWFPQSTQGLEIGIINCKSATEEAMGSRNWRPLQLHCKLICIALTFAFGTISIYSKN